MGKTLLDPVIFVRGKGQSVQRGGVRPSQAEIIARRSGERAEKDTSRGGCRIQEKIGFLTVPDIIFQYESFLILEQKMNHDFVIILFDTG